MSQNNKYKKIPSTITTKLNFETKMLSRMPYFAYINLTISSFGATYRAYTNNDMSMVAFLAFVVIIYFVVDICLRVLNRTEVDDSPKKKLCLKIVVWVLTSALLLGFAYRLRTFASFTLTVLVFFAVGSCSACIFFAYFVRDDKKERSTSNVDDEKIEKCVEAV